MANHGKPHQPLQANCATSAQNFLPKVVHINRFARTHCITVHQNIYLFALLHWPFPWNSWAKFGHIVPRTPSKYITHINGSIWKSFWEGEKTWNFRMVSLCVHEQGSSLGTSITISIARYRLQEHVAVNHWSDFCVVNIPPNSDDVTRRSHQTSHASGLFSEMMNVRSPAESYLEIHWSYHRFAMGHSPNPWTPTGGVLVSPSFWKSLAVKKLRTKHGREEDSQACSWRKEKHWTQCDILPRFFWSLSLALLC